jgi:hypothetical protein
MEIIRYMFRSYDHLQVEIYTSEMNMTGMYAVRLTCANNLKFGCLHPVARIRSGSGVPSNASLFQ